MVTLEELDARAALVEDNATLSALCDRLAERARPLIERMPTVPTVKALLSRDGGVCSKDRAPLVFDPWSPHAHRCTRCGSVEQGERHHRFWARFQHLWIAERAAHLAAVAAFTDDPAAARRACDLLAAYRSYESYPNVDNVLGPARLFFSTYLESVWLTNYLAAATLLRESGTLDEETDAVVSSVADQAAALIGEFDEGYSNRQTWNDAALAAVAVWFEDAELATRAIEGETGILSHLAHGFGADGTWHEGENYHLFALQGLLTGIRWARAAGVDALADADLAARLAAALRAPTLTALPDLTFPARKDSRFGVSLAQPMYLELWESGLGALAGRPDIDTSQLESWLSRLYESPAPAAQLFESWLHEAGEPAPVSRGRTDLSWVSLLELAPDATSPADDHRPESVHLETQGLAILRTGGRYVSLECGPWTGGHGHPDRLHLTVHDGTVHWLPDFGTGSYVDRDLFWYRSTLAHNAPLLDGISQQAGDARCVAFDAQAEWGWVRGTWNDVSRTVVAGAHYVLDVVELASETERRLELPWHPAGELNVTADGSWQPDRLEGEFVSAVERFTPAAAGPVTAVATDGARSLTFHLDGGELLRAVAPGPPGAGPTTFLLLRAVGKGARFVTVVSSGTVRALSSEGSIIRVVTETGTDEHAARSEGWEIASGGATVQLAGLRTQRAVFEPLVTRIRPQRETAHALRLGAPPPLDGTMDGFDDGAPLHLDHEDQYRRSEEPYEGSEAFSAMVWANWDDEALYVAIRVTKSDLMFRAPDAKPLDLDNEPDDINSDGLQLYVKTPDLPAAGALIVPAPDGTIRSRKASGFAELPVRGAWDEVEGGYLVTVALMPGGWDDALRDGAVEFDVIVNEMRPGRERRAGQLVWTGGGGWVWLRGDRHDPGRLGVLELS